MSLDFKAANAACAASILSICRKYLPKGVQKGDWWLATVPWRADRTPSLGVSLTTGRWKDFGRPGEGGDCLDLLARLKSTTAAAIVREMQGADS